MEPLAMTYNAAIDRTEAGPLIPEDAAREIISAATEKSFVLSTFPRVPMTRKQKRLPILDRKPVAYFVNGDTGLKQTTDMKWDNVFLNAEELAVLVPIPDLIYDDTDYDLWGLVKPQVTEAIGAKVDDAVLFGTGKPTLWPNAIAVDAAAAGNQVTGGVASATHDVFDDLNATLAKLEDDGFDPNAWLMRPSMRATLRNVRDSSRGFLYGAAGPANTGAQNMSWAGEVWNVPAKVSKMGLSGFAAGASNTLAFAFDTSMFRVAIRDDINMRVFDQGVISDGAGVVLLNLMQQDTKVLRVTFRLAWVAANPVTLMQPTRTAAYPAAQLLQGTFVPTMAELGGELPAGATRALPGDQQPQLTEEQPVPATARPTRTTERAAERTERSAR
jgi:HK97 family phage major capsid protein